jgi:hypothetical protein
MGSVMNSITDEIGLSNTSEQERAGREARAASETTAGYQTDAWNYMLEQERLPSELRSGALSQLGALQGLGGDREAAMQNLQNSPIFKAIMAGQQQGEASILRNAGMTGGVRSGNTQGSLGQYAQGLNLQALMASMGGLTDLSRLPSYAPMIAGQQAGIGQTLGQGMVAESQGYLAGSQSYVDAMRQERQYAHEAGMSAMGNSDSRLKKDIIKTGIKNGFNTYKWVWNSIANSIGLSGEGFGVMAQEVELINPDAVGVLNGYKAVNYDLIGVNHG